MTKQGKLTNTEKYACQGMIHNGKTVEEIADQLDRPIHTVKKYVEVELAKIHDTIVKVQQSQQSQQLQQPQTEIQPNIENPENKPIKSKDLFIMTTRDKKEKGVAISTEAASQHGDKAKKKASVLSRHASGNLYRLSDGKILEQGDKLKE